MVRAMPGPVRLMVFEGFGRSRYGEVVSLPLLKQGMTNIEVARLRAYLWAVFEGKYPSESRTFDPSDNRTFDASLKRAVERFQSLEGLSVDGVAGKDTWTRLFAILKPGDTVVVGSSGGGGGSTTGGDQANKDEGHIPLTVPGPDTSSSTAAFVVAGVAALGLLWAINKGRK